MKKTLGNIRKGNSLLDPGIPTRFLLSLVVVPVIATVPFDKWEALLALTPLVIFFIITLGVPSKKTLRLSLFILPVIAIVIVPVFYGGSGGVGHISAGKLRISYYPESLRTAALIIARSFLALLAAVSLLHGIRFIEFVKVIEFMRPPPAIVMAFSIAMNFFGRFEEEVGKLLLARKARTIRQSYRTFLAHSASALAVLFLRSIRVAENLHLAMVARGFSGRMARTMKSPEIRGEYLVLVLAYVILARALLG